MHLKNKKLILKIKELSLKFYEKKVIVIIEKIYRDTNKRPFGVVATIVNDDDNLLEIGKNTTTKALKKLKKLLKKKIAESEAFKQSAAEIEMTIKNAEHKKEILKKDVEFWKLANAAEQNEIVVKETINNTALSSMATEPEQLSLPFTQEKKDEQLGK